VHALAYPIGGLFHVPHGLSNSLVLAPVLRFNRQHARAGYAELARTIEVADSGTDDLGAADAFIDAMAALVAAMPYEQRLREVGVQEADLPRLADDAMNVQRLLVNNPREVSREDALALYREAF
jgi:alcohol dehydrogenase class IV